jgi:hypothetical protein
MNAVEAIMKVRKRHKIPLHENSYVCQFGRAVDVVFCCYGSTYHARIESHGGMDFVPARERLNMSFIGYVEYVANNTGCEFTVVLPLGKYDDE